MRDLTVVFDLDGTLIDTAPDLIRCANHALGLAGVEPVEASVLRPSISFGARRMIEIGLASRGCTLDPATVDRLLTGFLDHYLATIADQSRPFPGLPAVLDELAAGGARIAICTNKLEGMAIALLDALDYTSRFHFISGRDTFAVCKPHPEHLLQTIARAGGRARQAIMVGDSDVDIATAKAAGVPVIAVDFGYCEQPVARFQPDAVISHYAEFFGSLGRIRGGKNH